MRIIKNETKSKKNWFLKATEIVRRIDDLGCAVISQEIRSTYVHLGKRPVIDVDMVEAILLQYYGLEKWLNWDCK